MSRTRKTTEKAAQPVPLIDRGIRITATTCAPLNVTVNGKPGQIAILDEHGQVIASGRQVGFECAAVLRGAVERYWEACGWLTVVNVAETIAEAADDLNGAISVSGVAEKGLDLTRENGTKGGAA